MKVHRVGKTQIIMKPEDHTITVTVMVGSRVVVKKELSKENNSLKWSQKKKEYFTAGHLIARFSLNAWPNTLTARSVKATTEDGEKEHFSGVLATWK